MDQPNENYEYQKMNTYKTVNDSLTQLLVYSCQRQQIEISQIIFLKGENNYTHIYTKSNIKITIPRCLKYFEEMLITGDFIRIHRSYIINFQYVKLINLLEKKITLVDGTELAVSRRRFRFCKKFVMLNYKIEYITKDNKIVKLNKDYF